MIAEPSPTPSAIPVSISSDAPHDTWFYVSLAFACFAVVQAVIYYIQLRWQMKLFHQTKLAHEESRESSIAAKLAAEATAAATQVLIKQHDIERERLEAERPYLLVTKTTLTRTEVSPSEWEWPGSLRRLQLSFAFGNLGERPASGVEIRAALVSVPQIRARAKASDDDFDLETYSMFANLEHDYFNDEFTRFREYESALFSAMQVKGVFEFQDELRSVGMTFDGQGIPIDGVTSQVGIKSLPFVSGYGATPDLSLIELGKEDLSYYDGSRSSPANVQYAVFCVAIHNETLVSPRRAEDAWIELRIPQADLEYLLTEASEESAES